MIHFYVWGDLLIRADWIVEASRARGVLLGTGRISQQSALQSLYIAIQSEKMTFENFSPVSCIVISALVAQLVAR